METLLDWKSVQASLQPSAWQLISKLDEGVAVPYYRGGEAYQTILTPFQSASEEMSLRNVCRGGVKPQRVPRATRICRAVVGASLPDGTSPGIIALGRVSMTDDHEASRSECEKRVAWTFREAHGLLTKSELAVETELWPASATLLGNCMDFHFKWRNGRLSWSEVVASRVEGASTPDMQSACEQLGHSYVRIDILE